MTDSNATDQTAESPGRVLDQESTAARAKKKARCARESKAQVRQKNLGFIYESEMKDQAKMYLRATDAMPALWV
jgi:hypothetical protein